MFRVSYSLSFDLALHSKPLNDPKPTTINLLNSRIPNSEDPSQDLTCDDVEGGIAPQC